MNWAFFVLGALTFLVFLSAALKKLPIAFRIMSMVISLTLMALTMYFLMGPQTLSGEVWYDKSPWLEILLLLIMVLGMFARTLSKAIDTRREKINKLASNGEVKSKPKLELDFWDMLYPLLFAFPTFGALLGQLENEELTTSVTILAFETGFLWQTVVKSR